MEKCYILDHGNLRTMKMDKRDKPDYGIYVWPLFIFMTLQGIIGIFLIATSSSTGVWFFISGIILAGFGFYQILVLYLLQKLSEKKEDHLANKILSFINPKNEKLVFDLGSGTGRTSILMAKNLENSKVVGIDIYSGKTLSGNSPDRAYENAEIEGIKNKVFFNYGDALHIPFRDGVFDIATSGSVIHIFPKEKQRLILKEINRVLKCDGRLIMIEWLRCPKTALLFLFATFFVFQTEEYWTRLLEESDLKDVKTLRIGGLGIISAKK
ncbi:MAG: class I SAM-dependent methyltransferase [Candidatus Hodarchaeota archaeon]